MSRRILVALMLVATVAIAAFFVPAALAIRDAQERGELLALQREATVVASRVPASGPIAESVLGPTVDSEHLLGLYGPDGSLLEGVGPAEPDAVVRAALVGDFAEGRVGDDLVAAVPVRVLVDGSNLVVRIEAPRSESRRRYVRSLVELGGAAVAVLGVAALVGVWVTRRINRPIDELRRWAADPDAGRPPPAETGIVELDSLRADLLAGRARIDELLRRERSFSSHVSHQLRTPVAAMRVAVETELAAPRTDPTELLRESIGQLDRLESTISSLLALARHDRRPDELIDLVDLIRERVAGHEPSGRAITVTGDVCHVVTDPAAIGHIVDVLIDNALRHGRGVVDVRVGRDDSFASVDVADQGPTPEPAATFSDATTDAGHGIGLRLARTLAESIGGELTLLDRATTTFRLTVPLGDRHDAGGRSDDA